MSCKFGSQKKQGSIDYINEDNIGVFCFMFNLEGDACRLFDLLPSICKSIAKLRKEQSVYKDVDVLSKLIVKVAKEGYRIAVNQQDQIVVEGFCKKAPPPLPTDITLIDIYRFIGGLVPIIDRFFTGIEIVFGAESLLLYKIVGFYLYQKWYENCECKKPPVIRGCTDQNALNWKYDATEDDGSCRYIENPPTEWIYGCTDFRATNYNPDANFDDSTCIYSIPDRPPLACPEGFTGNMVRTDGYFIDQIDEITGYQTYKRSQFFFPDVQAGSDTNVQEGFYYVDPSIFGVDRVYYSVKSCAAPPPPEKPPQIFCDLYPDDPLCNISGCTDSSASNYNPLATIDDGSCQYDVYGCTDSSASNYNPLATIDDGSCQYDVYGCTDASASNYNPLATIDDGSCQYDVYGCTDSSAINYNPLATSDDGSCQYIQGCTDPRALNYNPLAVIDPNNECVFAPQFYGCTDRRAINYNPSAIVDNGSCQYDKKCESISIAVVEFSQCGSTRTNKTVELYSLTDDKELIQVVEFSQCGSTRTNKTVEIMRCNKP